MNVGNVFEVGGPISVLLVDGEPGYAALTSEVLGAHEDIETEVVATPSAAFDRMGVASFDCIVSESSFVNASGLDFLRQVRDAHPNLPFIFFTRHGSERVASDAIAAGVTDYLRKDTSTDTLDVLARRITNAVADARQATAFEQSHSWYETVVEESHVGLYVVRDGRLEFVNDYLLDLLGYEAKDVIDRPITDFVAEYDRHIVEERVSSQSATGIESTAYTVDIVDRHGKPIALKIIGRRISLGDETANVGVTTSAASHFGVEREIERAGRTTRQVISSLPDMVFLSEADTFDIVYINDAFKEIWGRPQSTLYEDAFSFLELVHVDDRARLEQAIEGLFVDVANDTLEDRYEFEFRFVPEGSETVRWATARAVPLYDEDGDITNILGVMTDLTERIRREQKLTQQNARLEAFARVLSHDIRGPLAVAQGRLDLARETGDDSHLDHVERAQRRIGEVVDDVLSLTYDERAIVDRSTVDLTDAASAAWDLFGPITGNVSVEIGTLPVVQADQSQMKRLFENLFRNAVEHGSTGNQTSSGDAVEHGSTSSQVSPDDAVEHGSTDNQASHDDCVEHGLVNGLDSSSATDLVIRVGPLPSERGFFVEDNGRGFSASIRDSLFDAGVSTKTGGENGLGLDIVRKIVHTHGWLIRTAESGTGGARFEVLFDTVGDEETTT